jgi:hypothetical protein
LFVCRQIVERQLHGRIELTRSSSAGTQFAIHLAGEQFRNHPDLLPAASEPVREAEPETAILN